MGIFNFFKGKKENSNDSVLRVNWNDTEDVGIVTHYKGKPFTGVCFGLHDNGNLEGENEMLDGLKHGKAVAYHDNGNLAYEANFKDDLQFGLWKDYNIKGQLVSEGLLKDGKPQGLVKFRYYHKNGELESEGTSLDGLQEGPWKYFYENGQLASEGDCKEGKPVGYWKHYSENGEKIEQEDPKARDLSGINDGEDEFKSQDDFYLTGNMKKWIEKKVIPEFKKIYQVKNKQEMFELDGISHDGYYIDWVDVFQDCSIYVGEWEVDEILEINKDNFQDEEDYFETRSEKFEESFGNSESQIIQNLSRDYFDEFEW